MSLSAEFWMQDGLSTRATQGITSTLELTLVNVGLNWLWSMSACISCV